MTLRELVQKLNELLPVHGDCDVQISTINDDYFEDIKSIIPDVTDGSGKFPIIVIETNAYPSCQECGKPLPTESYYSEYCPKCFQEFGEK